MGLSVAAEEKRRGEERRGEERRGEERRERNRRIRVFLFAAGEQRREENREELDESGGTATQVSFRRFLELVAEWTSVQ